MEKVFVESPSESRLILIFAGWGMDATPFSQLRKPGYDILVVSDYTGFHCGDAWGWLEDDCRRYGEIVVVAWSFGVRIAAEFLKKERDRLPVTRAIAVNGTTQHVDDSCGIPQAIFNGTRRGLSPVTVRKFQRRMFASAREFAVFQEWMPSRDFESLRDELDTFVELQPLNADPAMWDLAIGGGADAIFPIENQRNGWHGVAFREEPEMTHFPDFQEIINRDVIDKKLVATRFAAASETYVDNASVQATVASRLWEKAMPLIDKLISVHGRQPLKIVEVGAGRGVLTSLYLPLLGSHNIELWDIASVAPDGMPENAVFRCCDAETAIRRLPECSVDLLLSSSTLQWFNSPASFVRDAVRVLRPGGVMALATFGTGTYGELSALTGNALNYPSLPTLCNALHDVSIRHAEEETITGLFPDVRSLLRHIKLTGVNALPPRSAADTLRLVRNYPLTSDGEAPLTYSPIYLIVEKR